jgi:FkbM family methyltransferase
MKTPAGRRIFLAAYAAYKDLSAPDLSHVRPLVRPGGWIVDIGANVGYFSRIFSTWVSGGARVLAFEPEAQNFESLAAMVAQQMPRDLIDCRQCLVAELDGELPLALNPDNPADHRIGSSGVPTRSVRLDTVMAELAWPAVSLIKIDVQGAEVRVLEGARDTVKRNRPALVIEIDDEALASSGSSPCSIEAPLGKMGYRMFAAEERGFGTCLDSKRAAEVRSRLGYADFVFVPEERVPQS